MQCSGAGVRMRMEMKGVIRKGSLSALAGLWGCGVCPHLHPGTVPAVPGAAEGRWVPSPASSSTRSPEHPSARVPSSLLGLCRPPARSPLLRVSPPPWGCSLQLPTLRPSPSGGGGDKGPGAAGVQPPSLARVLRVRAPTLSLSPGISHPPADGAGCGCFPGGFPASLSPVALQFR